MTSYINSLLSICYSSHLVHLNLWSSFFQESESEIEDEVDILMSSDIVAATMPTKYITFSRARSGWLFKEDKTVNHLLIMLHFVKLYFYPYDIFPFCLFNEMMQVCFFTKHLGFCYILSLYFNIISDHKPQLIRHFLSTFLHFLNLWEV